MISALLKTDQPAFHILDVAKDLGIGRYAVQKLIDEGHLQALPGVNKTMIVRDSYQRYLSVNSPRESESDASRLKPFLKAEYLEMLLGALDKNAQEEYVRDMTQAIDEGRREKPYMSQISSRLASSHDIEEVPLYDLGAVVFFDSANSTGDTLSTDFDAYRKKNRKIFNSEIFAEYETLNFRGEVSFEEYLSLKRMQFVDEILGR